MSSKDWQLSSIWLCKFEQPVYLQKLCCLLCKRVMVTKPLWGWRSHYTYRVLSHSVVSNSLLCHEGSPPSSSVHGSSQARMLEWVSICSSRRSSWPRNWTRVSCIGKWILYHWATWEAHLWITMCPITLPCFLFIIAFNLPQQVEDAILTPV